MPTIILTLFLNRAKLDGELMFRSILKKLLWLLPIWSDFDSRQMREDFESAFVRSNVGNS